MQSLIALAVVSGATVFSIGVALLLECLLLKVVLGMVARAKATEEAAEQAQPSFAEMRRHADGARLAAHLG